MSVELELRDVSKRYGRSRALDAVSFVCRPGTITAFCGPNGAGKSTALRVLTGITRPDSGAALVAGRRLVEIEEPARDVGVLLDASAFHSGRTVRETLRLGAFTIGATKSRADECAELVGLETVRSRRVGQLSLGMRQRLGLAHALVGRPGALVLDEPSNGLDPNGMLWLDSVLRRFAGDGGTVLVSTHHLAAVERTAHRLVAISRGSVVADVDVAQVRGSSSIVASDDARLPGLLRSTGAVVQVAGDALRVELDATTVGRIAHAEGIALTELRRDDRRLDHFLADVTRVEYEGVRS